MKNIQAISSNSGRLIVGRIFPEMDLIQGIQQICKENSIRFGVVVGIIGSLSQGLIVYAKPSKDNKLGIRYSENTYLKGPLELLSCQGLIGEDEEGSFQIHLHGLMGNKNMEIVGGHFIPDGNLILATAEVAIMEVTEGQFIRRFDMDIGFPLFNII